MHRSLEGLGRAESQRVWEVQWPKPWALQPLLPSCLAACPSSAVQQLCALGQVAQPLCTSVSRGENGVRAVPLSLGFVKII